MNRKIKVTGIILFSALLVGCAKTNTTAAGYGSQIGKSTDSQSNQFDELSEKVKVVLYASIMNTSIKDNLSSGAMKLNYDLENNELFLSEDNGIGKTQTMRYILLDNNVVEPLQSINLNLDTKKADNVATQNIKPITKEILYQSYLQNKDSFDKAANNVSNNRYVYLDFIAGLRNTGSPMALGLNETNQLTDSELALAAYIRNYLKNGDDDVNTNIVSTINTMLNDSFIRRFNKTEDGYNLDGIQQTYRQNFRFTDKDIICTLSPSDYSFKETGSSTVTVDKDELQSNYASYKGLLKLLSHSIPVSEEYSKRLRSVVVPELRQSTENNSSDVDTRNLTTQQSINWVKNYMLQDGATQSAVDDLGFDCKMDTDGYVKIYVYMWVPTHAYRRLDYTYRIDGNGYLQLENGQGSDDWETISTRYIN